MNFINKLIKVVKGLLHVERKTVESALDIDIAESDKMYNAINLWEMMYTNTAPWVDDEIVFSCNLASQVAAEYARLATIESGIEITGSPRADYLKEQFNNVKNCLRNKTEIGCAYGGLILKPCLKNNNLVVDYIKQGDFFPVSFDASGRIDEIVFVDQFTDGDIIYTKLEHHKLDASMLAIKNKVYESNSAYSLGKEIALSSVDQWKSIEPIVTIQNISTPLYGYFKVPTANQIDPDSPLGVSVFSRARRQIEEADKQFGRFLWEFEGSELAIDIDETRLSTDTNGNKVLPKGKERLFRYYKSNDDFLMNPFSPPIRDVSQINGLNELKRQIEDLCFLSRGSISAPDTEAKTATELKILKQRSYAAVADTQKSLEFALKDLIAAMDIFATLYSLAPVGDYETIFKWDDSIITDEDATRARQMTEVSQGIMPKWEYRMRQYGEDEATAKAMVEQETITFGMEDNPAFQQDTAVDVQGKALNGAQTQSLIAIMAQYSASEITEGQAVNLISTAIGIDKAEAKRILNGEL